MNEITPKRLSTIEVDAEEIYKIDYVQSCYICVSNRTEGNLLISDNENMQGDESIVISAGGAYNDLFVAGQIYLKAEMAGQVCIVRKG